MTAAIAVLPAGLRTLPAIGLFILIGLLLASYPPAGLVAAAAPFALGGAAKWHQERTPRSADQARVRLPGVLAGSLLMVGVMAVGLTAVLPPAFSYALAAVPLLAVLLAPLRRAGAPVDLTPPAALLLYAFVGYGLAGSLFGRVVGHSTSSHLATFMPMAMVLAAFSLRRRRWSDAECERFGIGLMRIFVCYSVFAAVAANRVVPGLDYYFYRHNKAFVVIGAIALAWQYRRATALAIAVAAGAASLVAYPAATYPLVLLVIVLMYVQFNVATRYRRLAGFGLAIFLALIALAFLNLDRSGEIGNSYFASVDKSDNSATRLQLWSAAVVRISESPWTGDLFTGDLTVEVRGLIAGVQELEPHNDFLQLAMGGGVPAAALFTVALIYMNVLAIRRFRLVRGSTTDLLRVIVVIVDGFAVTALFNPVLSTPIHAATVGVLLGAVLHLLSDSEAPQRSLDGR